MNEVYKPNSLILATLSHNSSLMSGYDGMSEKYKRMNDILDVSIDLFSALRAKGVHVEYKPDSEIIIHRIAKQEHGAA